MKQYPSTAMRVCVFAVFAAAHFAGAAFSQPQQEEGGLSALSSAISSAVMPTGADEADLALCPQGANVVGAFLAAWQKEDYDTMYALIDDGSKQDYSLQDARLDFMMTPFREYRISSVKKSGGDFEFMLSYGEWRYGDKDVKKMLISGKSFKIIMPSRGEFFKRSAASY